MGMFYVLRPSRPFGDTGPFEAEVIPHAYLHCWDCGDHPSWGATTRGDMIYCCRSCQVVIDVRRVP